jgi:hypothetical protein
MTVSIATHNWGMMLSLRQNSSMIKKTNDSNIRTDQKHNDQNNAFITWWPCSLP